MHLGYIFDLHSLTRFEICRQLHVLFCQMCISKISEFKKMFFFPGLANSPLGILTKPSNVIARRLLIKENIVYRLKVNMNN